MNINKTQTSSYSNREGYSHLFISHTIQKCLMALWANQ